MDRQAIAVSLTPGVLLLVAAIVSKFLEVELAEVVFQFSALAAVAGGGAVAWKNVYSQRTMEHIAAEQRATGAAEEQRSRDSLERGQSELWQDREDVSYMGDY